MTELKSEPLNIYMIGSLAYQPALELQYYLNEKRQNREIGDTLLLLEHKPVFTTGRREQGHNMIGDPSAIGAEVIRTNRGGEVTYHGPGQITGYLFIDLARFNHRVKQFVTDLEEVFIRLLKKEYNLDADRHEKHRGVWVGLNKITAIGVAISHGVTMHGFAFNVNTDLSHFNLIVPCGINDEGRGVTSLEKVTGVPLDMMTVREQIGTWFADVYHYKPHFYKNLPDEWVEILKGGSF